MLGRLALLLFSFLAVAINKFNQVRNKIFVTLGDLFPLQK
jgi:hypothetical protein